MALQESSEGEGAGRRSRSIKETVNGTHHFTIEGYSLGKLTGVGEYVASAIFPAGGYQWAIYVYLNGKTAEDKSLYLSVFIVLASEGTDVLAQFALTLLDQTTKAEHKVYSHFDREPYTLKKCGSMMYAPLPGYKRFIRQADLETSDFLKNDKLSISCTVGVVVFLHVIYGFGTLSQHLDALLDSGEGDATFGDVTFEVDGEFFQAHKALLAARSPVFKALLYGPLPNEKGAKFLIKEIEAPVFKAMLHFAYTDVVPDFNEVTGSTLSSSTQMAQHLFAAADRFELDGLRLLCESKLCKDVSIDTVATTLLLADQHCASKLKVACVKYAAAHLAGVMRSDGFKYLKDNFPSLADVLVMAEVLVLRSYPFKCFTDSFPSHQERLKVLRIIAGIDEERSWIRN